MRTVKSNDLTLNKEWLLTRVTQEEIFARYMMLSTSQIWQMINTSKKITSFFRGDDTNASMGFTQNSKGKIICRDFGGYFWGDCFDLVGWCVGLDPKKSQDFIYILADIYSEFNLKNSDRLDRIVSIKKKTRKEIIPILADWNFDTASYWHLAGINKKILDYLKIYPVSQAYVNGYLYIKDNKKPTFAYYSGIDESEIQLWKLYSPYNDGDRKFIANHYNVDVFNPGTKIALIVKSRKDLATILAHCNEDFTSYVLAGEGQTMSSTQLQYIKETHDIVYTFSDGDKAGLRMAIQYRKALNSIPLFFKKKHGVKDIFEFAVLAKDKVSPLINEVKKLRHGREYGNSSISTIIGAVTRIRFDVPF